MNNPIEEKYAISTVSKEVNGKKVYRIVSLVDIPRYDVKIGTMGGYVEGFNNLSHLHDCWISDEAIVMDNARVTMDAHISGSAIVQDTSVVKEDARVEDSATVKGRSVLAKRAVVSGNAHVENSRISTTVRVTGKAFVYHCVLGGNALIYGSPTLRESNIVGEVEITDNAFVSKCKIRGKRIEISMNARLTDVKVGTSKCKYIDVRGNSTIEGSEISGQGVFISEDAVIKTGVVVEGETTHIGGYAEVTGNIHLGKFINILEFAKLLNLDDETWKFTNKVFDGDFELVEYNT